MKSRLLLVAIAGALALPAVSQETTPAMVAAAEKEGKVVWYASVDVKVAEAVKKAFKEKYPKIDVDVERSGSERIFQRINQEYQSGIKNADVVNSSDASHFLFWKQQGWLAKHVPPDTARFPSTGKDAGDFTGSVCVPGGAKVNAMSSHSRLLVHCTDF